MLLFLLKLGLVKDKFGGWKMMVEDGGFLFGCGVGIEFGCVLGDFFFVVKGV